MSNTQVIFKPGGVIALVLVCGTVVTAGIIGLRARNAANAAKTSPAMTGGTANAPAPTAAQPGYMIDPAMTGGEITDKELLVSLNATPGQAQDWLFLGPLSSGRAITNTESNKDDEATMRTIIGTSYIPTEAKFQAHENVPVTVNGTTYRWKKVKGSAFDFKELFATPQTPRTSLINTVVYGYTTIESKTAEKRTLHFRSDDGAIVWVNGEKVYFGDKIRGIDDEDIIPIKLRPGRNNVLVKVGQGSGGWGMSFQLQDTASAP